MKEICASSFSGKRWFLRACDDTQVLSFSQKLNVSPFLARLLSMRGYTLDSAPIFLKPFLRTHLPNPFVLKDMKKAVERLVKAVMEKEKIVIWGDYDVDGATSSALLFRFFEALKICPAVYIPDRTQEGYGLNLPGVQKFINEQYAVMITVDCGTTSFEVLETIDGLDVIVLDHHASEAKLPKTYALINPNRLDEDSSTHQTLGNLAAVGISFLCVVALNSELRKRGFYKDRAEPDLLALLDLVALGTVCDVMPLTGLNRTFVAQGLKVLAKRQNIGLKVLADQAGLNEVPNPYHLGFVFGPRINAGGRIGESFLGTRLLSTDNPTEAIEIAQKLERYNQKRRDLEAVALEQALCQVNPSAPAIIVEHVDWHEGVIGIVAGRLKEKFHKPTAVIAWNDKGVGKASARSVPGFDFGQFIHKAHHKGLVMGGGGHAMAAGFSLTKEQLPSFTDFLNCELEKVGIEVDLTPSLVCDGYLDFSALTADFLQNLESFSPFGVGNPSPKFIFTDVIVNSYTLIQDQHIRCRFSQGDGRTVDGIGFRLNNTALGKALMEGKGRPLQLLASPKVDVWKGVSKITLLIEDTAVSSFQDK